MSQIPDFTSAIVVGTDGSPTAEGAIDWAAQRAVRDDATLVVLTAMPTVPLPTRAALRQARQGGEPVEYLVRDRAQRRALGAAERVRAAHPDLTVESRVEAGEAWEPLVAATRTARLVVVGARGESAPLRARALGGIADAVVTRAHGPVVVIPQGIGGLTVGPVVVGFDGSKASIEAVAIALDQAYAAAEDLVVVHAWDPTQHVREGDTRWAPDEQAILEWVHQEVDPCLPGHEEVTVRYLTPSGPAALNLIDASRQASLVVIGSRGRGGVAGLLLGSVSRTVLRGAHCPVLVTRGASSS